MRIEMLTAPLAKLQINNERFGCTKFSAEKENVQK